MSDSCAAPLPVVPAGGGCPGDVEPASWEVVAALRKPAYLHVRLLATPTNHRAPPA